jgi:hypothetical protein
MSVFDSHQFKKLKKKWDERLKADGFQDVETHQGREILDLHMRRDFRPGTFEAIRDYYSWASSMVWHGRFKRKSKRARASDIDIWRLHAEGKSTREIGRELAGRMRRPLDQKYIWNRIQAIRAYLREQEGVETVKTRRICLDTNIFIEIPEDTKRARVGVDGRSWQILRQYDEEMHVYFAIFAQQASVEKPREPKINMRRRRVA